MQNSYRFTRLLEGIQEDCNPMKAASLLLMRYRQLGRTPWKASEISFGAWAIGGAWGSVDDNESLAALRQAIDSGVNFIDTADVYGMGRSERLIAQLKRERKEDIVVATKAGRRLPKQTVEGYDEKTLTGFIEDSLRNLSPIASTCCSSTARPPASTTTPKSSASSIA